MTIQVKTTVAIAAAFVTSCFGVSCQNRVPGSLNRPLMSFQQEITSPLSRLRMRPNQTIQIPVVVRNTSNEAWVSRGMAPVLISYKWLADGTMLPDEGERTVLPDVVRPSDAVSLQLRVVAPRTPVRLTLAVSVVQEGVAWFMSNGGDALYIPVELVDEEVALSTTPLASFSHRITSSFGRLLVKPSEVLELPVEIQNTTTASWSSVGTMPVVVSYKWIQAGSTLPIEGERTPLPRIVRPGETVSVLVRVVAPLSGSDLVLRVTLVQEGVAWFMSRGARSLEIPVDLQ